ncbi:hypothetical protein LTY36_01285 [Limosilactobacillus agrestis]|uniref:Uncharacterized protein n=1 Tax=Limosilactobacillus agrestis TaxID=2759748 RepID=A0A7W3YLF6_9LACO|nr:hypothetical protein [Limosilactobacillus agrestis]MBB1095207.1 hypothetical protein [Limosilactobacillus agrestis]MCD7129856.1 hypothetical protein [Limosilactobacillus agrestis]
MTMTSVKKLEQVTYEKKNGKLIIHDQARIIIAEGFSKMMDTTLPSIPQLPHLKISLAKTLNHNFGNVYLARFYPNEQVEILRSAPLLVKFKTEYINGQETWGFEIPNSVNLSSELKKHNANAVVWLPVMEVND